MVVSDGIIAALVPFQAFHFIKEKLQSGGYIPLFWFQKKKFEMLQSEAELSFEGAMVLTLDLQILSLKIQGNEMH